MGEIKEEATNEVEAKDSLGSEEEIAAEAAPKEAEEGHVVLTYPERVPNAEKGADHAHAYVMLKVLVVLIVFSFVIAKFTSPF
ncbi:hypothetical protein HOB96_00215 [bacterium]|jgi:uncharacterized membrane protein|nr:hypothetical protein [bacterium]MBT4633858.1 hypothetical protein [bacterium]